MDMRKQTLDEFVAKAVLRHCDKYDYSKVNYVNNSVKVCIVCPVHGEFWQTPANHLHGQGCPKCRGKGYTTEEMIRRFKGVHGDKYDYSKVEFVRTDFKVCIVCPIHGEFWQEPRLHLMGMGCKYCAGKEMTTEEFIRRAKSIHGNKYDYSKVEYKNSKDKVCIVCPVHGEFWQTPGNHLNGKNGCPTCGHISAHNKTCSNINDFLRKAYSVHGGRYDYSKVEYYNADTKVCVICPVHGEFWQTPYKHITCGQGCPKCNSSHLENEIRTMLLDSGINFEEQKTFDWLKYYKKLRLDFFLPDYNMAIECQGIQHFLPVDFCSKGAEHAARNHDFVVKRDAVKKELCHKYGIKLIYYSDANIEYPYYVYTDKKMLLNEIKLSYGTAYSK